MGLFGSRDKKAADTNQRQNNEQPTTPPSGSVHSTSARSAHSLSSLTSKLGSLTHLPSRLKHKHRRKSATSFDSPQGEEEEQGEHSISSSDLPLHVKPHKSTTNHRDLRFSVFHPELDLMFKDRRQVAQTVHGFLSLVTPYLTESHPISIPDFTYNLSSSFSLTRTTVATNDPDLPEADIQLIHLATRPQYVTRIYEWLVFLGQVKNHGTGRFKSLPPVNTPPAMDPMNLNLQFADPTDGESLTNITSGSARDLLVDCMDPILITGPRHIGKSHIMLQVGARLASAPDVVVVYIGTCSDLLLLENNENDKNAKYAYLVEYIVCAFCEHPEVNNFGDEWYKSTNMGKMGCEIATSTLLRSLSDLCKSKGVTAVFMLDEYEKIDGVPAQDVIFNATELTSAYGFMTILSTSNANHFHTPSAYQCVITGVLEGIDEASNMAMALYPDLAVPEDDLERLAVAAEYYPLDLVKMLAQYENRLEQGTLDLQLIISEQDLSRRTRIAHMHMEFLDEQHQKETNNISKPQVSAATSAAAAAATATTINSETSIGAGDVARTGHDNQLIKNSATSDQPLNIASSDHRLDRITREVMRAVFSVYHHLDFKLGSIRDLQMMAAEVSGNATKLTLPQIRRYGSRTFPPSAAAVLYGLHFNGTVYEQFHWLFDAVQSKHEVDAHERVMFFDLSLIELGRINATATNPLSGDRWDVKLDFSRGSVRAPLDTTTFDAAIAFAHKIVDEQKLVKSPRYYPRVMTEESQKLESSVILHFPELGYVESWMTGSVTSLTHNEGSFMIAVTRVDNFTRSPQREATYTGCEFELTWIANDPICITPSSTTPTATGQAEDTMLQEKVGSSGGNDYNIDPRVAQLQQTSKDTSDMDALYGPTESWSAKAIKLFPELNSRTRSSFKNDIGAVKLLALTVQSRLSAMVEQKAKLMEDPGIGEYATTKDTIGLVSVSNITALRRVMDYV